MRKFVILLVIIGLSLGIIITSVITTSITMVASAEASSLTSEDNSITEFDDTNIIYKGGKFVFPAPKMVRVSSEYGYRVHPITGTRKYHGGMDLAAPGGSPILACSDGVVVLASFHRGYGNHVIIAHGNNIYTLYAHSSQLLVKKGDSVKAGQQIAKIGTTGSSTGNHLHIEVWVGGYGQKYRVNPRPYIFGM